MELIDTKVTRRMICDGELIVRRPGTFCAPISVVPREISNYTLYFVTDIAFAPQTLVSARLIVTEDSDPIEAKGRIISQSVITSKFLFLTALYLSDIEPRSRQRLRLFISGNTKRITLQRNTARCSLRRQLNYVLPQRGTASYEGTGADVSTEGMRLVLQHSCDPGEQIAVRIGFPRHIGSLCVSGVISWTQKKIDGIYVAGVKFSNMREQPRVLLHNYIRSTMTV